MGSLFANNIIYRMLYFMKNVLQRFMSYTLISHTNAYAVRSRPTTKDVELFGMDRRSTNLWLESYPTVQSLYWFRINLTVVNARYGARKYALRASSFQLKGRFVAFSFSSTLSLLKFPVDSKKDEGATLQTSVSD